MWWWGRKLRLRLPHVVGMFLSAFYSSSFCLCLPHVVGMFLMWWWGRKLRLRLPHVVGMFLLWMRSHSLSKCLPHVVGMFPLAKRLCFFCGTCCGSPNTSLNSSAVSAFLKPHFSATWLAQVFRKIFKFCRSQGVPRQGRWQKRRITNALHFDPFCLSCPHQKTTKFPSKSSPGRTFLGFVDTV